MNSPEARYARPVGGMETFAKGELIGTDYGAEIRASCDGRTIFMPSRDPITWRALV